MILDPSLSPPGAKNQVFGGFLGFWTLVSHGNTFVHSLWCKGEVMATSSRAWGPSEVPIPFQHNQTPEKASCCNKGTTRLCATSLQTEMDHMMMRLLKFDLVTQQRSLKAPDTMGTPWESRLGPNLDFGGHQLNLHFCPKWGLVEGAQLFTPM